eukprot:c12389_g2_i2.p1 GENE.c12389_g2_i2~~c12389_g2_i2.p1  ORF type:complete len:429 (-),score=138.23 c12389_g2_i2:35-1249(-)
MADQSSMTKTKAKQWVRDMSITPPEKILQEGNVQDFLQDFFAFVAVADDSLVADLEVLLKRVMKTESGANLFQVSVGGTTVLAFLQGGMANQNNQIRTSSFSLVSVVAANPAGAKAIVSDMSVLQSVMAGFSDHVVPIAASTSRIVVQICGFEEGLKRFCSDEVQGWIQNTQNQLSPEHVLRVIDTVLQASCLFANVLSHTTKLPWFQCIPELLNDTSDLLLRVSVFEVLFAYANPLHTHTVPVPMPHTRDVLSYLCFEPSINLIDIIHKEISAGLSTASDSFAALTTSISLKLAGRLAQQSDELASSVVSSGLSAQAVSTLRMTDVDYQIKEAGILSVYWLSQTSTGRKTIQDERMIDWVTQQARGLISDSITNLQPRDFASSSSATSRPRPEPVVAVMHDRM